VKSLLRILVFLVAAKAAGDERPPLPAPWKGDAPNAESWPAQRVALREQWTKLLGPFPKEKAPLSPHWLGEPDTFPGYTRRKVAYTIEPGVEMDAVLFLPTGAKRPVPGIVVFHPTLKAHYAQVAGYDTSSPEKMMGPQLASKGFAVLCPRCFIFDDSEDYKGLVAKMQAKHPDWRGTTRMTWDGIRAVDYLVSLPEVDARRLGIIGHSLGAKEVLYVAAFDDRVKATVFSEGGIGLAMSNWHDVWYLGAQIREPGFTHDHHELLALIAPRPFLLLAGGENGAADSAASQRYLDAVHPLYRALGREDALVFSLHHTGHRYPPEARAIAEDFLTKHLKP
jgi:dienelactone hydrolase